MRRRTIAPLAPALAAGVLAACRSAPPAPAPAPPPAVVAPAVSVVLGRDERFLVYQPGDDDTLRSIAARFLGDASRDWTIRDANDGAEAQPGRPLVVPLRAPRPGGVEPERYQTVPILCYHRFGANASKMVVTPANFAAQLDWLADNGYHVVPLARMVGWLEGREALPPRAVVITIDDGYESVWRHALPLLRQHGFPATLFVYTDFVGSGGALSWAQLEEIAAEGLVDVQSHSKSHRDLVERNADETDAQYRANLEAEARVPQDLLEKHLHTAQRFYAYPYGDANELVLDTLARRRVELGLSVTAGGNPFWAQPLLLRRTMIFGEFDLAAFKARLQTSRPIAAP